MESRSCCNTLSNCKGVWRRSACTSRVRLSVRKAPIRTVCSSGSDWSNQNSQRNENDDSPPEVSGDWRAFRARLVGQEIRERRAALQHVQPEILRNGNGNGHNNGKSASGKRWAHLLSQPEKGCLLISRRSDMRFFNNTVVFLAHHDDKSGSVGLILNFPSPMKVKEADVGNVAGCFADKPVYVGGPVENNLFLCLHTCSDCEGANEVIDGIYTTDVVQLNNFVTTTNGTASNVKIMAGYAGWGPYQLADELMNGSWWVVAASGDVILDSLVDTEVGKKAYWEEVLRLAGVDPAAENGL